MNELYLDADACPVKEEAYRVAARHRWKVWVVTCQQMRDPGRAGVELVTVQAGPDEADDWIAERVGPGDLCVTDDIPLASRCVCRGAKSITGRGRVFHEDNIGEAVATRDLLEHLRSTGALPEGTGGGPAPFTRRDRSKFLEQLEQVMREMNRRSE